MTGEAPLDWSEIYERLARRPERPDPLAMDALERRVRAWASVRASGLSREVADEVAAATCAEVWRTINLARGGAAFEGFVQGRFVEAAGEARRQREQDEQSQRDERGERLSRCLEELRARNPRHHGAIVLLYDGRATVHEAADALGVDVWTVRTLAARARLALAQCLERAERRGAQRDGGKTGPPRNRTGRSGGKPSHRPGRRPPRG